MCPDRAGRLFLAGRWLFALTPDKIDDVNAEIKIIHPKPDQLVASVDSAFILGNVPAENDELAYKLFINDHFVPVHPHGGFIAFLPLAPDTFEFKLEAFLVEKDRYRDLDQSSTKDDILSIHIQRALTRTLSVFVPEPMREAAAWIRQPSTANSLHRWAML